jgi:hypothetical protein
MAAIQTQICEQPKRQELRIGRILDVDDVCHCRTCIGLIMIFVWALTGDNESRKNYYRALLAWFGPDALCFHIERHWRRSNERGC